VVWKVVSQELRMAY